MTTTEKAYLQEQITKNNYVTVFLINGFQKHGIIEGDDSNAIFFKEEGRGKTQMIYKHAISTIQPL